MIIISASAPVVFASPLKIIHSASMPPLSFINEEGNADGILIDLWKEWSKKSGSDVSFELTNWKEAMSMTGRNPDTINGGLFYSPDRAEQLIFGNCLFSMRGALFTDNQNDGLSKLDMQNTICGVIKGGYSKIYMETNFPFTALMLFDSAKELFKTAAEGRIKMFVADYPVAMYQLKKFKINDKFKCQKILYSRELYPAVHHQNQKLLGRINYFMTAIPKSRRQEIIKKWMPLPDERYWHITTVIILTFLTILIFAFMQRQRIMPLISKCKILNIFKP